MRIVTLLYKSVRRCHWSITPVMLAILFLSPLKIFSQAANLDQIRNGPASDPSKNFWDNFDNPQHINGNAGESNAHYIEGHSISYRSLITGVAIGKVYEYVIEYDTKHSGRMAIDYITHFQRLLPHTQFGHPAETINPLIFESGSNEYLLTPTSTNTFAIPPPLQDSTPVAGQPQTSFNALSANDKLFTIYNGLITAIEYVREEPLTTSATESKTSVRIRFTAHDDSVVLAWGGHIASQEDWFFIPGTTTPRSAAGISGSPYHTRHLSMRNVTDNQNISLGNQDRSLSAKAVIAAPTCGISPAQFACPETDSLRFNYTNGTTGVTFLWSLFANTANAVIEGSTTGSSIKIVPGAGGDFTAGGVFSIKLVVTKNGIKDSCTLSPAGSIADVRVTATATPPVVNLAVIDTSQLLATVTPGPSDTATYTFLWTQTPASGGSLNTTTLPNPVFTATAIGTYRFIVTVTQKAAPNCVARDTVFVEVETENVPCGISGPDPVCPKTTNTYKFDPNNDGVADPIPDNFTITWSFSGNSNNATLNGPLNDTTVTVTAGALCETSYRLKIVVRSTSGLLEDSCFKVVNVNVNSDLVIDCPDDDNVTCTESKDPTNTGTPVVANNGCGIKVYYKDVITRTWIAEDACGNRDTCTQVITVTDSCVTTNTIPANSARMITNTAPAPATQGVVSPVTSTSKLKSNIKNSPVISPRTTSNAAIKDLQVQAFPNPFSNTVNFRFTSPVSGRAVLEVFNTQGQRVGIVFDGKIDAGVAKSVQFSTRLTNQALIYKLKVGDKTVRGTVLELKR